MKSRQLFLSIVFILCCQSVTAGKFTQLLDGSPGANAKKSRIMAKINAISPSKQDQIGCNQEIGSVQQSNRGGNVNQEIYIKGDIINACK